LPGAVNSEGSAVFASMSANGTVYFSSSRKTGQYDVFRSRLENGQYQTAEDLGSAFNSPGINTFESMVAPDEAYILLGSFGRPGGFGSSDLFVSFQQQGQWSNIINLGPQVNTRARDYSPRISANGEWLYFTSETGFLDVAPKQAYSYPLFNENL